MTATQVQTQLLEEIETLSLAQRLILLDLIRSFRGTVQVASPPTAAGPLKLHYSPASTAVAFRREEIYGDDGR